jgi:hypothetical protein
MREIKEIDLLEAGRYLGYASPPDAAMLERMAEGARRVTEAAVPRYIYAGWPATAREASSGAAGAGCELRGAVFLPGTSIARHMNGCAEGILLAATLGAGVDALLRRAALTDLLDSVIMDACATALAEQVMNAAEAEIRLERESAVPVYFTGRFSPGYGDLPLSIQPDILRLLDAPRRIGLSATDTHILIPRKSVTAVIGRAAAVLPAEGSLPAAPCAEAGRCGSCALRGACPSRVP